MNTEGEKGRHKRRKGDTEGEIEGHRMRERDNK